jgi:hypothetical protein
VEELSTVVDNL